MRRLQICTISPRKGLFFASNVASYPPPSAQLSSQDLLSELKRLESLLGEAQSSGNEGLVNYYTKLFTELARTLDEFDLSSLSNDEREQALRFRRARSRLLGSLPEKKPEQKVPWQLLEIPENLHAFGKSLRALNAQVSALHRSPSPTPEVKKALDLGISAINGILLSDASEAGELPHSKHYMAFLKLADYYEKAVKRFLSSAQKNDLRGMLEVSGALGINLPKLLYEQGIYVKTGKVKKGDYKFSSEIKSIFAKKDKLRQRHAARSRKHHKVSRDEVKRMLHRATSSSKSQATHK